MSSKDTSTTKTPTLEITVDATARHDILSGNGVHKGCKQLIREREGRGGASVSKTENSLYGTLYTYYWFNGETNNEERIKDLIYFVSTRPTHHIVDRRKDKEFYSSSM